MEVNNVAPQSSENNSGVGFLLGIIILVAFVFFLFYYGIPIIRNMTQQAPPATAQPTPPAPDNGIDIDIPDEVDLNINQ